MANEVNQLTINAAGDGWVDVIPNAVATGYTKQNIAISYTSLGRDTTSITISGNTLTIASSGYIDIDGVMFYTTSSTGLALSSGATKYIQVIAGSSDTQKTLELTETVPTWDTEKNGLYNGSNRVLNWIIPRYNWGWKLSKILDPQYFGVPQSIYGFARIIDIPHIYYNNSLSTFNSPNTYAPGGMTFDGTNLITSDSGLHLIYVLDGISGTILSSFSTPASNICGMTFDGTNLITSDSGTGLIYIHDGISDTILSSFSSPAPIGYSNGLAFDGTNLISGATNSSGSGGSIYIHDGISSTILDSAALPGTNRAKTLTFDGKNVIVASAVGSTPIYFYDVSTLSLVGSFDFTDIIPYSDNGPMGMAFDGVQLIVHNWTSNSNPDYIYVLGHSA